MANTKYDIGQTLYVERNGECKPINIIDICYVLDGRINNKKYISEWELDDAYMDGTVQLTQEFFRQKKIAETKEQIGKLQKELSELEKVNKND
jgi:hypothetical protein